MSTAPEVRTDPLAPIQFVVTLIGTLLLLVLLLTVPLTVFGSGSLFGIGEREACVTVGIGAVPFGEADGGGGFFVPGLRHDADFMPQTLLICDRSPTTAVKAAAAAAQAADLFFLIGFLALTGRLLRTARRSGLFTSAVAAGSRAVGWYLVLGALAARTVALIGDNVVVRSAVRDVSWSTRPFDVPWAVLITGAGVLTLARVLRHAVELQDEVDATV